MRTLRMLELLTAGVQERLWITDPYFLSLPILTQSLMATARDGVDVRVLNPATVDIAWIGRASRAGYKQFLEAGVRIFEYGGPMIHAKTLVADGWLSKVGSTNLNFSSLAANWEIDLVVEDTDFASQMEELFEDDVSKSREVRLEGSGQRQRSGQIARWTPQTAVRAPVSLAAARDRGRPSPGLAPPSSRKGTAPTNPRARHGCRGERHCSGGRCSARVSRAWSLALDGGGCLSRGLGLLRAIQARLSDREKDRPDSGATCGEGGRYGTEPKSGDRERAGGCS